MKSEPTLYTLGELVRAANVKHVPTSLKLLLKEAVPVVRCVHGNTGRHSIIHPRDDGGFGPRPRVNCTGEPCSHDEKRPHRVEDHLWCMGIGGDDAV